MTEKFILMKRGEIQMVERREGKVWYSYDDIHALVKRMSQDIQEKNIDVIIAMGTGGWFPARLLRKLLPYEGELPLPIYSLGIVNYDSKDKQLNEPIIVQPLPRDLLLEEKVVLVVDEVVDSGTSFLRVKENISKQYHPKELYTGAIHCKAGSCFIPDFVGEFSEKKTWIEYPWDQI